MCGTMNPVTNVQCDQCQARLIPMVAPGYAEPEQVPISESYPPLTSPEEQIEQPVESVTAEIEPTDREAGDWLAQLRAAAEEEEIQETETMGEPIEPVELPTWLRSMGPLGVEARPTPAQEQPFAEAPAEGEEAERFQEPALAEELPDWLRKFAPPAAPPAPTPPTVEAVPEEALPTLPPPVPAEEIPDWLREIAPPPAAPPTPTPPTAEAAPEEALPAVLPLVAAEIPDWLRGIAPPPAAAPEAAPPTAEALAGRPPSAAPEVPEWLHEFAPAEEEAPGEAPPETAPPVPLAVQALAEVEAPQIPGWLAELRAETARPPAPTVPTFEETGEAEGLARAEIPDWLKVMRPRPEAAGTTIKGEEPVETEGPLEGLGGVLTPTSAIQAPAIPETLRTPELSQVSLSRAQLLQSLLAQPAEALQPEAPRRGIGTGERLQRWLVAIVLLIAVGSTLLAPGGGIPTLTTPAQSPVADGRMDFQRLTRAYDLVQGMHAESTVLVAFEYGPPEADELNLVAEPILRHLLAQGAHISISSTRPEGQAIAARLLRDISASEEQYTSLGYRPGDAAGVSQFLSTAGTRPALILILTAQPGPLRWWIEQTRALYGDALPVVAGVSAALEPAASPYLDASAKQLVGAVSGLSGAAAYETLRNPAQQANPRLNALAAGHVAIVGLIILGAVFYVLGSPRGKGK